MSDAARDHDRRRPALPYRTYLRLFLFLFRLCPVNADASASNANTTKVGSPPQTGVSKRPSAKRARASGAVKREPVEDSLGGPRMGMGMAQRPGTSTGYEGAATAGYMDVDVDMDDVSFFVLFSLARLAASPLEKLWSEIALETRSSRTPAADAHALDDVGTALAAFLPAIPASFLASSLMLNFSHPPSAPPNVPRQSHSESQHKLEQDPSPPPVGSGARSFRGDNSANKFRQWQDGSGF
ncbi:hypothetical protein B0H14DRAFT_3426432 [Mycena olivaceomarginata]|nr:hypothetical protein B0H14DRAFT_3426432 [Mycena olivaceomarginata]